MGHPQPKPRCAVCRIEVSASGTNNYLDPRTGEVRQLCDKHIAQAQEADNATQGTETEPSPSGEDLR